MAINIAEQAPHSKQQHTPCFRHNNNRLVAATPLQAYFRMDQLLDSEEGKAELRRLVAGNKPK